MNSTLRDLNAVYDAVVNASCQPNLTKEDVQKAVDDAWDWARADGPYSPPSNRLSVVVREG